jgi:hypothetical protein
MSFLMSMLRHFAKYKILEYCCKINYPVTESYISYANLNS